MELREREGSKGNNRWKQKSQNLAAKFLFDNFAFGSTDFPQTAFFQTKVWMPDY
jgi:hypothetical protein